MALSHEISSLKAGIHKLAVAVEKLALRKFIEGEIDISKLPWFTPQYVPGDSIKLSSDYIPTSTVRLDKNEVIGSPIIEVSDSSVGALQTLDEMSEPNLSSNNLVVLSQNDNSLLNVVEMEVVFDDDHQQSVDCRSKEEGEAPNAHQLFDKIDEPNFCPSQVQMVEVDTAHNVFDKLPVPDFILEMAQAAKTSQCELNDRERELGSDEVYNDQKSEQSLTSNHDHYVQCDDTLISDDDKLLSYDDRVNAQQYNADDFEHASDTISDSSIKVAKLGSIESFYVYNLVIMGANKERFSKLDSLFKCHQFCRGKSEGDQYDYLMLTPSIDGVRDTLGWKSRFFCKEVHNFDNVYQVDVVNEPFKILHPYEPTILCHYITWLMCSYTSCILACDIRDHVCLTTLGVIVSYKCFDPGIESLFSNLTLEDKGDFRGEEGGIYVRDTWVLIMDGISCHNCPLSQIDKSMSIPTRTFDPGGLAWDGCKAIITWSDFVYGRNKMSAFLDSIYDRGGECHGMEGQMKVFDPGLIFMNRSQRSRYNGFEGQQLMANVFCEGGSELFPTYIFNLGDGCSLMGAYSLRRANDTSSIYWLFLLYEHYDSRYLKVKNTMAPLRRQNKAFIHDVAHVGTTPLCLWPAPQLAAQKSLSLPGAIALATLLPLVFLAPTHAPATHAISFPWPSLVPSSALGQMKTSATDGFEPSNFVFDPGGKDSGPKMDKPQAYSWSNQRLKAIRRENHQTYVFDPRGSLTMYDIDEPKNASIITCL